jgi:hypothetical protein
VWYFSSTVEQAMDAAEAALTKSSKGKATGDDLTKVRREAMNQFLPPPPVDRNAPIPKGRYADPAFFAKVEKRR